MKVFPEELAPDRYHLVSIFAWLTFANAWGIPITFVAPDMFWEIYGGILSSHWLTTSSELVLRWGFHITCLFLALSLAGLMGACFTRICYALLATLGGVLPCLQLPGAYHMFRALFRPLIRPIGGLGS